MRGQLDEKLVWYWNHSTVKSPVPTAQSLLPATDTYWFEPLKDKLPPLVACPTPANARTAAATTDAASARRPFTQGSVFRPAEILAGSVDAEAFGNHAELGIGLHHGHTHVA